MGARCGLSERSSRAPNAPAQRAAKLSKVARTVPSQTSVRNRLLLRLSPEDYDLVSAHLEFIKLPKGHVIAEPGVAFTHVFFLESGVGSIVVRSAEGHQVEAGLFGLEGFSPVEAVLGSDTSPHLILIQVADDAWRLPVDVLRRAADASPSLRGLLLRYVQALNTQSAFTALSNAMHPIEERLARWVLMCDDRTDTNEMALTHESLSIMLGVRRPTVTTALHMLEGNRFIRTERGVITVVDRNGLEEFAGDAYGVPEAEYERLIGPLRAARRPVSAG